MGYAILVMVSVGFLALVHHLRSEARKPDHLLRVRFDQVGTLMAEDPIKMRGVIIGKVRGFEPLPEGTLALMELFQREPLPEDAMFVNFNHSLMGARHVIVVPGKSDRPMDPEKVQPGVFANGVAETLHRVGNLLNLLLALQETADGLHRGRDSLLSFQGFLEQRVYPLLEKLAASGVIIDSLDQRLAAGDALTSSGLQAVAALPRWRKRLDSLAATAQAAQEPVHALLDKTEALLERMERYASLATDPQSPLHVLLSKPTFYEDLQHIIQVLRQATETLREEGLRDAIQWKNLHFLR